MNILGISSYYHDSSAALISDGHVAAAIEEERFSRIKHDNQFPHHAIRWCLDSMGLTIDDIDAISYYEKPLLKFERILDTFVQTYPFAIKPFIRTIPDWMGEKIRVEYTIRKATGWKKPIHFIPHHLSHAAVAFYTSPFSRAAILTVDGVGEYDTTAVWHGTPEDIRRIGSMAFPHSLGLLYSTFTAYLGFKVNEDEFKVMGLAAYGKPAYMNDIKRLISLNDDGSFRLNMSYFSFREAFRMWNSQFEDVFGKPRKSNDPLRKRHKDIAASIQLITEIVMERMVRHALNITGEKHLCIGGGVALNALSNGKLYSRTPVGRIHIFGAAGDSGAAIGSALYTHRLLTGTVPRPANPSMYVGTAHSTDLIRELLSAYPVSYREFSLEQTLLTTVAGLLARGNVVGWFQGRCEIGPRALGNRSILCMPNPRQMKERMNIIKRREQFRPFAGSVLQHKVHEYFEVPNRNHTSPYMNFCFRVKEGKRKELAAIVHEDNTCRIQTVSQSNGRYFRLLEAFYANTGIACFLNTSFNLRGEPIVEHPKQALDDFLKTRMDYLVIEDFLIEKRRNR